MRMRRLSILMYLGAVSLSGAGGCDALTDEPIVTVLPPADAEPGRWVILDGANNTRDIGGYATGDGRHVRWRTVYRSGALCDLTSDGCAAYQNLGIRRVIDFRNRLSPAAPFGGDAVCVQLVSEVILLVVRGADDLDVPTYVQTVRDCGDSYRGAFELIADPESLPLLYHCSAGKDRTGIMTALLLTLLGVDRATVIAEFQLSDLVGAETYPQAVVDLLDEVDRLGGIESYLAAIGVSADTQAAVRNNLLE